MRGEPMLHPDVLDIISIFRANLPNGSLMLTTNGDTLRGHMQERVEKLFKVGLNLLLLDTYYPKERRDALREEAFALKDMFVIDFFKTWAGQGQSPYSNQSKHRRLVVVMDDLAVRDKEHSSRQVKSHAGSNPTADVSQGLAPGFPLKRNCGRPFRELVIHSNGNVPLCCDDWKQEYVIGNVNKMTLEELWKHPRMEAARARLFAKDRSFGPCQLCDAPMAPRTGLLPVYEPPTEEEIKLTETTFKYKLPMWQGRGKS